MRADEIRALKKLYTSLAIARALDELGEALPYEDERKAEQELAERLKADALCHYYSQRGTAANLEEFDLVWLSVRDDLVREVLALEAMRSY